MKSARMIGSLSLVLLAAVWACRAGEGKLVEIKKGQHYRVLAGRTIASGGSGGVVSLRVDVTDGWKLNAKAPFILKLAGSGAVKPARDKLRKKDAGKQGKHFIYFEIPFTGKVQAGSSLGCRFDFVICNDTMCQKKRFMLDYQLAGK